MKNLLHSLAGAALAIALFAAGPAGAVATLTAQPVPNPVAVGDQFTVAVYIDDAGGLFAYNLSLRYDPALVHFLSVTEGSFLGGAGATYFAAGVDDGLGSVGFSAATLLGAIDGASGAGNLLNFQFEAMGGGLAIFDFADVLFLNAALDDLPVNALAGEVAIAGSAAVPEPPGALMLFTAALGIVWLRRGVRRS